MRKEKEGEGGGGRERERGSDLRASQLHYSIKQAKLWFVENIDLIFS